MAHEVRWIKPERLLYVSYQGHQTPDTLKACLDAMADQLDTVKQPVWILINWLEVTSAEKKVLMSQPGHRAYSHPMAARGLLIGFERLEAFENEVAVVNTRHEKNTQYFDSLEQAMEYVQPFLTEA